MKLSSRTRYGLRILLDIAAYQFDGPVRVMDIAARLGISIKYIEKLIRRLKAAGFTNSKPGPHGGHTLTREPASINLADVVRTMEGSVVIECITNPEVCEISATCPARKIWLTALDGFYTALKAYTLADLQADPSLQLPARSLPCMQGE